MKKTEIAGLVLQHDARNLQLKRRLAERGIDWRTRCETTCRFRAPTRRRALLLQQQLRQKGFLTIELLPQPHLSSWCVQAKGYDSLEHVASHEFTEEIVHLAAALSCSYEGWEARITPQAA